MLGRGRESLRSEPGPKTSSPSSSRGIVTVASSAKACESRDGLEKRGAGGRGRLGLPPYLEDGVPGRGLPFNSEGSNERLVGGGRENSETLDEGVHGLCGEPPSLPAKGTYVESGGGMARVSSLIELALEGDVTLG